MTRNQHIVVRDLPQGDLEEHHFEMREGDVPSVGDGEALVRTILTSWTDSRTHRVRRSGCCRATIAVNEWGVWPLTRSVDRT
jgi:NADPH-dependent curcumin reductase CurA